MPLKQQGWLILYRDDPFIMGIIIFKMFCGFANDFSVKFVIFWYLVGHFFVFDWPIYYLIWVPGGYLKTLSLFGLAVPTKKA